MKSFQHTMQEAAYEGLLKTNPNIIAELKNAIRLGESAHDVEKRLKAKYSEGNLIVTSAILAAYHIESHPELLNE